MNGGTIIASLAIGDEPGVPDWVLADLLPTCLTAIKISVAAYAPDGGWLEGPIYHGRVSSSMKYLNGSF